MTLKGQGRDPIIFNCSCSSSHRCSSSCRYSSSRRCSSRCRCRCNLVVVVVLVVVVMFKLLHLAEICTLTSAF